MTFNMQDPEEAQRVVKLHKDLITFHTDPKYRQLNQAFFDKIEGLHVEEQLHACQVELSNAVVSYYITQAVRMRVEAEKMQREVAAEVPGTGHAI